MFKQIKPSHYEQTKQNHNPPEMVSKINKVFLSPKAVFLGSFGVLRNFNDKMSNSLEHFRNNVQNNDTTTYSVST